MAQEVADGEVHHGTQYDQEEEAPIPSAIEYIAGGEEKEILQLEVIAKYKPVQGENYR